MATITTAFKEGTLEESGWTSQYSFVPDWLLKLNNRFYSVKDGQLWLHNDRNNPKRSNFYGIQYPSSITTILNDFISDDKIFKTVVLESDEKWKAELLTNYTNGKIEANEFNTRESRQFSFVRGNEDVSSMRGNAVQGLGTFLIDIDNNIVFGNINAMVSVGDVLYQLNGEIQEEIGEITGIDRETNIITVDNIITLPQANLFSFAMKNQRAEGEEIRGHYMEVKLSSESPIHSELFAVSSNAVKSFV